MYGTSFSASTKFNLAMRDGPYMTPLIRWLFHTGWALEIAEVNVIQSPVVWVNYFLFFLHFHLCGGCSYSFFL